MLNFNDAIMMKQKNNKMEKLRKVSPEWEKWWESLESRQLFHVETGDSEFTRKKTLATSYVYNVLFSLVFFFFWSLNAMFPPVKDWAVCVCWANRAVQAVGRLYMRAVCASSVQQT